MSSPFVTVSAESLQRASDMVGGVERDLETVLFRALGRGLSAAKTAGTKKIRERYRAKHRGLSKAIRLERPSRGALTGALVNKSARTSLIDFKTNPVIPEERRPRVGLRAQVLQGGGGVIPGAFVARMQSSKVGVFVRTGKGPLPIKMLFGPATAQMMGSPDVVDAMRERALEVVDARLVHEVDHLMRAKARKLGAL